MGRPALMTLEHVKQIEDYSDLLKAVTDDGEIDPQEQVLLMRQFEAIHDGGHCIHESLTFASRAMQGAGIYGAWFEQMRRANVKDRKYLKRGLRVVVRNDDGPEPSGPGGKKKAA